MITSVLEMVVGEGFHVFSCIIELLFDVLRNSSQYLLRASSKQRTRVGAVRP